MASHRFTVRLDDERAAWVDEQADQRDRSRAWVIREAVDLARGEESAFGAVRTDAESTGEVNTGAVRTDDVLAAIDELAERLEAVEDALQERTGPEAETSDSEAASSGVTPSERDEPHTPDELVPETGGDSVATERAVERGPVDAGEWPAIEDLPGLHYREEPVDELERAMRDALDELTITGRGAATKRVRREATVWAWNYLREHGTRRSSEIANATFGAYWGRDHLGYSTSGAGPYAAYGVWDSYLRDVLKQLPGVEAPPERGSRWRFDEGAVDGSGVYDPTAEF